MTPQVERLREEILTLEPALMETATRMSRDEIEAQHLVQLTLTEAFAAGETRADPDADTRLWVFGILRSTFHSVARRRSVRQERGHYATQRQLDTAAASPVEA
jgi:DNA-directed RNA polymerase specialized sigma24 family protein